MFQILYVSGAQRPMEPADIAAILDVSRRNNARDGITGLLIYAEQTFIQFLEGERRAVLSLTNRIQCDDRHRNLMVMMEREAPARVFDGWHMGCRGIDPTRADEARAFRLSRQALEGRASGPEAAMVLETILAFAGEPVA